MTQEDIVILSQLLDQKFEPVYTRLDLLESDVRELKSGMSEIKQRVASVEQKVRGLGSGHLGCPGHRHHDQQVKKINACNAKFTLDKRRIF